MIALPLAMPLLSFIRFLFCYLFMSSISFSELFASFAMFLAQAKKVTNTISKLSKECECRKIEEEKKNGWKYLITIYAIAIWRGNRIGIVPSQCAIKLLDQRTDKNIISSVAFDKISTNCVQKRTAFKNEIDSHVACIDSSVRITHASNWIVN